MNRVLFLFIIFFALCAESGAQFLSYSSGPKSSSLSLGYCNHYFRFNDSEIELTKREQIGFEKYVPEINYETDNLRLSLAYNSSKFNGKNMELFSVDGYYKLLVPVTRPDDFFVSIPVLLRTSYLKVIQELEVSSSRIENGNVGLGTGIQLKQTFSGIGFRFIYDFCINYSTINFSIDYGYSTQNEVIFAVDFDQIFDDFGIIFGGKYSDQTWKISDKKYNYYTSVYGAFIGITF